MIDVQKETAAIRQKMQNWRRQLHEIPEVGLHLPKTKAFVKEKLDHMGILYEEYPGHSGLTAVLGKKEGRCIALRADMDALPIQEENQVPYASKHPGCMHACGHDAHTAILLGTAEILKKNENAISGQIKLIFQPAEETPPGGALLMCRDGVLENPHVDAVLGVHMTRMIPGSQNGDVVLKNGSYMGADDVIQLTIRGKGGHASEPESCVDTIFAACSCIVALQQIVSRNINPNHAAVITITDFHAGSGTDNVIPEEAKIIGTVRTSNEETRKIILKRIREVIKGTMEAAGADFDLKLIPDYPVLVNDKKMTDLVRKSVRELYGEHHVVEETTCSMGGDDFAFFSREVPGCYFTLAADKAASDGIIYQAHHPKFDIDDSILDRGVAIFMKTALAYLENECK